MINIKILRNLQNQIDHFICSGHSTAHKDGNLICAGISAITQTCVLGLKSIKHTIRIQNAKGYLSIRLVDAPTEKSELLLNTMMLGILSIDKLYPGVISILDVKRKQ